MPYDLSALANFSQRQAQTLNPYAGRTLSELAQGSQQMRDARRMNMLNSRKDQFGDWLQNQIGAGQEPTRPQVASRVASFDPQSALNIMWETKQRELKQPDESAIPEEAKQIMIDLRQLNGIKFGSNWLALRKEEKDEIQSRINVKSNRLNELMNSGAIQPQSIPAQTPAPAVQTPEVEAPIVETPAPQEPDIKGELNAMAEDKDGFAGIDNLAMLNKKVADWAKANGLRDEDADTQVLYKFVKDLDETARTNFSSDLQNKGEKREETKLADQQAKDTFGVFKDATTELNKKTAATVALGQSMKDAIQGAIDRGETELDLNNSQKLAAMAYQTYNPGTLVAGEMSSAVTAAKNASSWRQWIDAGYKAIGLSPNKIPIESAIKVYNEAMQSGVNSYNDYQKQSASLGKNKFVQTYNKGLVNPSSYLIGAKPQATNTLKVGTVEDGYRFNGGNPSDPKSWTKVGK